METLYQKRFLNKKKFKLTESGVEVYDKDVRQELEYSIDYLELGINKVKKTERSSLFFEIMMLCFFALEFGLLIHTLIFEPELKQILFWTIASGFFLSFYLLISLTAKRKMIYLTGGQKSVEFFQEKPTKKDVDAFIEELTKRIKTAYINEYLNWDDSVSKEVKKNQIEWLRRIKIIDGAEAISMKNEIESKNGEISIGFKNE